MILHIGSVTTTEPEMNPAPEHPDTAPVVFDVRLAYAAIFFAALTFGVPTLLAVFR